MSYEEARRHAEEIYKKIGSISSPHFNGEYIIFNNIGFRHIIRKAKIRSKKEQIKRFGLLSEASKILQDSTAVMSYRSNIKLGRKTHYWAFYKEKNGIKIKVIIRQMGKGAKHFYSIISDP